MIEDERSRLDLATAYEEMNDPEGARQMLQELADAGSAEAAKRLAQLGGSPQPARRAQPPGPPPLRAQPPVNTGRPSVHIDENHSGGLILDDEERRGPRKTVDITYWIVDDESGGLLSKEPFSSFATAAEFVARNFADRERWLPPVPSEEEHAELVRILDFMEQEGERRWRNPGSTCGLWARLSYQLHQRTHLPEVEARIRAVLQGNPYESS